MDLVPCARCGKLVSEELDTCPTCGELLLDTLILHTIQKLERCEMCGLLHLQGESHTRSQRHQPFITYVYGKQKEVVQ